LISNANPIVGTKAGDNAAFGVQPQGYGQKTTDNDEQRLETEVNLTGIRQPGQPRRPPI
jgi:hypothetical protein